MRRDINNNSGLLDLTASVLSLIQSQRKKSMFQIFQQKILKNKSKSSDQNNQAINVIINKDKNLENLKIKEKAYSLFEPVRCITCGKFVEKSTALEKNGKYFCPPVVFSEKKPGV